MDDFIKNNLPQIALLISVGGVIYGWFAAGGKKAAEALDSYKIKNDTLVSGIDRRLQKMEDVLPSMPNREDFHKLELSLGRMEGNMQTNNVSMDHLVEALKTQANQMEKVTDYLRDASK